MIVASLLLILVAVTLLVLGLTGGSSSLLIGSIVASLLAAVALVIGSRQGAGARRAAAEPAPDLAGPDQVFQDEPVFEDERAFAESRTAAPEFAAASTSPDSGQVDPAVARSGRSATDDSASAAATFAAESVSSAAPGDATPTDEPELDVDLGDDADDRAPWQTRDQQFATQPVDADAARGAREAAPDYDRASSAINAARSENPDEHAWRRDPGPAPAGRDAAPADEFAEPDADDPDDEPLPQAVRPTDAVRVARMDAEVLVVDGRPRYHVADCAHLVGRLTEPIPVNEAVELGFSPCGLCRPVDRLVAAAARR
jgi:hypothetical protein